MTTRPQNEVLTNLDLLRAVAVLFVLWDHSLNVLLYGDAGAHNWLSWMGRLGVLFFFVHTSCVLLMSLERHRGPRLFAKFYARRALRIYPLSVVAVLLVSLLGLSPEMQGRALIANLALTQNLTFAPDAFGSMWSLPLEVQMYLFLPFLFLLLKRFQSVWLLFVLFVLACPIAVWQPSHVARATVLAFVPCFLPGAIAYWLFRQKYAPFPSWCFPVALALITAGFLLHPGWGAPAWAVCLALGFGMPFFQQLRWQWLNRCTFFLAKYSYGIYLCHSVLLLVMRPTWVSLPLYLAAVVVLSMAAYHLIERPMIRVGYRATRQNNVKASVLAA